ncbi:tRNA(fMet)-specific endonuclease VapC [Pirellulimonas nuda]|uniref:Ribonuclease VapC n=1 Tax=Pirellulimonas nuda TaxID=2528009 RepID=A0A518D7I0_9BACT|nr:type II toxin-antitoxin system VapC family toxin [Pirellulimonas nuda]QDU87405.1 tRNA(fMet)-specific endonuclease VapC [Pirellulimonas nuda]
MPLIVDVSALAPLAFPDEDHHFAEAVVRELSRTDGLIPALFWFEIWNVLSVNVTRRDRLTEDRAIEFVTLLERLGLEVDPPPKSKELLALTFNYRITAYDAAYLELALRVDAPLATQDTDLLEAARASGGRLFLPPSSA